MNPLCLDTLIANRAPALRGNAGPGHRPAVLPLLVLLACCCASGALRAATVSAPDEPIGSSTAAGGLALPGASPGTRLLDKALTGTVSVGSKNLDLLLELQRNDAADANKPGQSQPGTAPTPGTRSATPAAKTLVAAPLPQAATLPAKSALSQGTLLGQDGALGPPQRPAVGLTRPDWTGVGRAGAVGMGSAEFDGAGGRGRTVDDLLDDRPRAEIDDGSSRFWPRRVREFVRDNRAWLLGGIAGLLLLGAGVRAYSQRRA